MVQLTEKYSVNDPSLNSFPEITGLQKIVFLQSELKENSKKTGHFIEMKAIIIEGQHKDFEYIERLNIINQNATAVKIAYKTLAQISESLGMVETPDNTEQLHNKPLLAEFYMEPGQPYEKLNPATGQMETKPGNPQPRIKKYLPAGNAAPAAQPVAQQATSAAQPAVAQQVNTASAPAAVPAWARQG